MKSSSYQILRVAAVIEVLSLLTLLVNLATAHVASIASTLGPIHGAAYVTVIISSFTLPGAPRNTKLFSLVPAIGGFLVIRRYGAEQTRPAQA